MSQTSKMVIVAIIAAAVGIGGAYLWQTNQSPILSLVDMQKELSQPKNTTELTCANEFSGVVKYNCEKSGGLFSNESCACPIEVELGQTQEMMYNKNTGYCQTTFGGPGGDAFAASIGLPYGDYGFFMDIIVNSCEKSGGEMSGAACVCSDNMVYDKLTGNCK